MQLLAIQLSSIVVLVYYLLLKPMDSAAFNLIYILNEVFIYISAVAMVLFSEYESSQILDGLSAMLTSALPWYASPSIFSL